MTTTAAGSRDSHQASPRGTLPLLLTLYVSQAIPLGFFITAMPVILRQKGLSLESVGLFSAIAFPWLVKFLWAPAIDRWSPGRRHYVSWVMLLQGASVLSVTALAFLDLGSQLPLVIAVAAVFMLLAATQDVASDGLAVTVLAAGQRGLGNGAQVGGYYLGQILGGGVMLMIFSRFGWTVALLAMAAFLALPLGPAARFDEGAAAGSRGIRKAVGMGSLGRFFRRPGAVTWTAVLLLFRGGETMATYVFNQMLVDKGLTTATIGWISGVVYAIGALAGAVTAGVLVERLGRRTSLATFATVQALALGGYVAAAGSTAVPVFTAAAFVAAFGGGLATTALYTSMMDASSPTAAATDFTLQQSLCAMGPLVGTALSGFSAATLGFAGHYVLCIAVVLATVALLLRISLPSAPQRAAEPVQASVHA